MTNEFEPMKKLKKYHNCKYDRVRWELATGTGSVFGTIYVKCFRYAIRCLYRRRIRYICKEYGIDTLY